MTLRWWVLSRGLAAASFRGEGEETGGLACVLPGQEAEDQSWLYVDGAKLLASGLGGWEERCSGVYSCRSSKLEAVLCVVVRPWTEALTLESIVQPGEHHLIASAYGPLGGRWCDGPLAHIGPDGRLASYLPAGGAGALKVPVPLAMLRGEDLAVAHQLEGSPGQRMHRCLFGQMQACLGGISPSWRVELSGWTLAAAVELVLLRQAVGDAEVVTQTAGAGPPPPAWRRLMQNLGITWSEALLSADVRLPGLWPALGEDQLEVMRAVLNARSDVLPRLLKL